MDFSKDLNMTEESKIPEVTQTIPTGPEATMPVDVYGMSINLPISQAKELISKRDNKTQEFREVNNKLLEADKAAKREAERANILEKMKAGDIDQVKEAASKEFKTKLEILQAKILDKEIKSSFYEADDFLKEYSDDAVKLFKSEFVIEYDENENIKANGKDIKEAVKEFINRKEIFRKASTQKASTIPSQKPINVKSTISPEEMMKKGLAEMFKK
jgi:hypothetical protein